MAYELHVTIDEKGNVRVEVRGIKGKACEGLSRPLTEALGEETEHGHTEEYRQVPLVRPGAQLQSKR